VGLVAGRSTLDVYKNCADALADCHKSTTKSPSAMADTNVIDLETESITHSSPEQTYRNKRKAADQPTLQNKRRRKGRSMLF
jgi:hypothetical protein